MIFFMQNDMEINVKDEFKFNMFCKLNTDGVLK